MLKKLDGIYRIDRKNIGYENPKGGKHENVFGFGVHYYEFSALK